MSKWQPIEAAAKAAGIVWDSYSEVWYATGDGPGIRYDWNPLTDDEAAFRLAVKLGLCVGPNFDGDKMVCFGEAGNNVTEPLKPDPYAATRRAIVRAAAAMGAA